MMALKRKPGRPRVNESPSADVHLTLPVSEYVQVYRMAQKRRESVQDVIRRGVRKLLTDDRGGSL